ncbi:MAG: hypothetical protein QOE92_1533 [Chloroflexota bacterium]|nr:hypothetical protein [Chloroflexota bacterium]
MLGIAVDFVFPRRCGGCRRRGEWFCADCRAATRSARTSVCMGCGRAVSIRPCPLCIDGEAVVESLVAAVVLSGPVREAVHRMKYGDRPQLARPLAALAASAAARTGGGVVVPVPLSPRRRRARGYNQAEVIAAELARGLGVAVDMRLQRRRETGTQVGRGGDDRRAALAGAFTWTGPPPAGDVLLIDDVITTGATLMECARALRGAGASRVHALAVAVG